MQTILGFFPFSPSLGVAWRGLVGGRGESKARAPQAVIVLLADVVSDKCSCVEEGLFSRADASATYPDVVERGQPSMVKTSCVEKFLWQKVIF
jgi:hypothetical protein